MKVSVKYQGVVVTEQTMQIHFMLTLGGAVKRASHVKVPLSELTHEAYVTAFERAARRRLIEVWSDEPLPPWQD